jgi:hypothetical protein
MRRIRAGGAPQNSKPAGSEGPDTSSQIEAADILLDLEPSAKDRLAQGRNRAMLEGHGEPATNKMRQRQRSAKVRAIDCARPCIHPWELTHDDWTPTACITGVFAQAGPEVGSGDGVLALLAAAEGTMTSGEDTDGDRRPAGADGVGSDSNKANWEGSSGGAWVTVVLDPVALGLPADWGVVEKRRVASTSGSGSKAYKLYTVGGKVFRSLSGAKGYQAEQTAVGPTLFMET